MKKLLFILLFILINQFTYAQSGAKLSFGTTYFQQDFLSLDNMCAGWNVRLAARLGAGVWFFSPELNYVNRGVFPQEGLNPFEKTPRIHTLKIPLGLGWKFKTTPKQKVFIKAGVIGSHVMILDDNDKYDFNDINDYYGGLYGTIGYDLRWFTIDYRYEKSINNNFQTIENSKFILHSLSLGINF